MSSASSFRSMRLAYSADRRMCDVVIAPTANGLGTVAIDTSPVSALLIAFGTDRRARDDDTLPADATGLLARRGWCGSLVAGTEIGSRFWLLQRAKHTDETLAAGQNYAAEAVADIVTDDGVTVATSVVWASRTQMTVTAQVGGTTFTMPVAVQ